jgi:hypothetical protein
VQEAAAPCRAVAQADAGGSVSQQTPSYVFTHYTEHTFTYRCKLLRKGISVMYYPIPVLVEHTRR